MLLYAFGQKRVISKPFGFNHFFLFWGFLILFLSNAEFASTDFPIFFLPVPRPSLYGALAWAFDLVSLVVLVCVGVALFRRLVLQPSYIDAKSADALLILSLVAGLMIAYFGFTGAKSPSGKTPGHTPCPSARISRRHWRLPSSGGRSAGGARLLVDPRLIFLGFLNYLPAASTCTSLPRFRIVSAFL